MDALGPITIVGAGGIGCAVGHALCAAGLNVTFVEANPKKVQWGQTHGVGIVGRPTCRAKFVNFDGWQPPVGELILLCTKCYSNADVLRRIADSATLLPIQNGFDDELEERAPTLEGIASFVSECLPNQTMTRITRAGRLHLGPLPLRPSLALRANARQPNALDKLADVLRRHAPFRVALVPNILPYKYTKLMYNAAVGPIASAAGVDNGGLLWQPQVRRIFFALLQENYDILSSAGVEMARIGPFHPDTVQRILKRPIIANSLAWAFYPSLRGTYCSMAGDISSGQTEVDNYNGHLLRLAAGRGCSLNQKLYDLIRRMERDRITPGPQRLQELIAA